MIGIQIGTYTDRSGSTDTTSQIIMAAESINRRAGWFFQNISDTVMYINFTSAASAAGTSIQLGAGQSISSGNFCTQERISLYCAVSGKKFVAKEFHQS